MARETARTDSPDSLAVSVPVAAQLLGVSATTAWEAVYRGEIPTFRIGKRRLVSREDLAQIVKSAPRGLAAAK